MEIRSESVDSAPRHGWVHVRLAVAVALTAVAYGIPFADTIAGALHGARAPLPAVLPVLVILIALGYRTPPRGVADAETNWIVATLVGVGALAGIELLADRMPTVAGLWHLQDFGAPVWFACVLAVLFGVRHVVRMWPLWLFTLCCASPLPQTLLTAALGGSDTAAALLTAVAGSVAVFLAGRMAAPALRAGAALACLAVSGLTAVTVGAHLPVLATTVLVGALFPTLATAALLTTQPARTALAAQAWAAPHEHTMRAMGTLVVAALALALLHPPTTRTPALPTVPAEWTDSAALQDPTPYDFVSRYTGSGASLVRYHTPIAPGLPALAVDVLTAPDRTTLTEASDIIWYPSTRPADYRTITDQPGLPVGSRIAYSNADAATDGTQSHWLVISWEWQAGNEFQRVNVVASQTLTGDRLPPDPQPVHLLDVSVRPALWVARQQPKDAGDVDDVVLTRALTLATALGNAAADQADGAAADA
jgi:hypothetical protein